MLISYPVASLANIITGQSAYVLSPENAVFTAFAASLFIRCYGGGVRWLEPDVWSWAKLRISNLSASLSQLLHRMLLVPLLEGHCKGSRK